MEDITLALVEGNAESDAVIVAQSLPALTGNGSSDLLCGACGEVVAKSLTTDAIGRTFRSSSRLLLKCVCGGENLIHEAGAGDETIN